MMAHQSSPSTLPAGRTALSTYRAEQSRIWQLPQAERPAANAALTGAKRELVNELAAKSLRQAVNEDADGEESVVWFWFNHFNVFWEKDSVGAALPGYLDDAIRPNVGGTFRALLQAATTHPAMLVYLDNWRNTKGHVNENQARELLELHTLGVDGGYTQSDVQEVARVLTGLGLRPLQPVRWPPELEPLVRLDGEFMFDPRRHDTAPKRVLGRSLHAPGFAEVEALLDILATHPATCRHLVRRLATFILGDDVPGTALLAAERAYAETGGHLGRTISALKDHATARPTDPGAVHTFKDPLRWVISAVHLLAAGRPVREARPLVHWLRLLGQPLFGRSTPDGYPLRGADWLNAGQLAQRLELARTIVGALPRIVDDAATPAELMNDSRVRALRNRLGATAREALGSARSPAEHLALLVASPEFMTRRPAEERT